MTKFMQKISMFAGLALAVGVSCLLYLWLNGQKAPAEPVRAVIKAPEKAPPPPLRFSETIPPGMRAVSLTVDEISGVSRSLRKGDRVDVIAVSTPYVYRNSNPRVIEKGQLSRVLAENIEILSFVPDKAGQSRGWPATLLMTPEQVSILKAAGHDPIKIRFLARNPTDADSPAAAPDGCLAFTSLDGATTLKEVRPADVNRRIRPGMRAISVLGSVGGFFGLVNPGDRVDVLYVNKYKNVMNMEEDAPDKKLEIVTPVRAGVTAFLQDVEVLATSGEFGWTSSENKESFTSRWITLQVSPADAEKVAFATAFSGGFMFPPPIRLLHRNSTDKERLPSRLTDGMDAMSQRVEYTKIGEIRGMMEKWRPFYKPRPSISDKGLKAYKEPNRLQSSPGR